MTIQNKLRTRQYTIDNETGRIQFHDIRFYMDENSGMWYPSATTVISWAYPKDPQFFEWLKQQGENADKVRDDAGASGSIVHQATETYDYGGLVSCMDAEGNPKYSIKEWQCIERYVEFSNKIKPEIHQIETVLVSSTYRLGGTLDRIITLPTIDGKRFIMDIKTSNMLHDSYWLQLEIYRRMWNEKFPDLYVEGTCILHLNAKTRTEKLSDFQGKGWKLVFPDKDNDHYFRLWEATRLLYDEKFGDMKPNNLSFQLSFQKENV